MTPEPGRSGGRCAGRARCLGRARPTRRRSGMGCAARSRSRTRPHRRSRSSRRRTYGRPSIAVMAGRQAMRPSRPARGSPGRAKSPRGCPGGSGAPNAAGLPATRSTRSRTRRPTPRATACAAPPPRTACTTASPSTRRRRPSGSHSGACGRRTPRPYAREVGRDLQPADPVAVDHRAASGRARRRDIVGVEEFAAEASVPGGRRGSRKRPEPGPRRQTLAVDRPGGATRPTGVRSRIRSVTPKGRA